MKHSKKMKDMAEQKNDFTFMDENQLSCQLIEAQYALKHSSGQKNAKSLLILVSGIELAGKGEAVKQLREWLDPRYLGVKADRPILLGSEQPFWQSYIPHIPAEGQIMLMFGNWYSDLIMTAMEATQPLDEIMFDDYVQQMNRFEQDLKNNHVDVIKVWFDLSWKTLQKRLDEVDQSELRFHKLHGLDWRNRKQYDTLQRLRQRFTQDWFILDGEDEKLRNQQFAQYILSALQHCPNHVQKAVGRWKSAKVPTLLQHPEQQQMDSSTYKAELKKLTRKVAQTLRVDRRKVIVVFEGMDAAGKGGAIKRIVKKLDPREYELYTIAAPEKFELRRPYLWRFWNKIGGDAEICIFDRSWYGRVLVERVEEYASKAEWQRAYDEINRFEHSLHQHGYVVIKFWLAISLDEQAKRFQAREQTPHKRFKITAEDWRNRERWDDYLQAAADMFERTDTQYAPWHIVATDDKNSARIAVLQSLLRRLKAE